MEGNFLTYAIDSHGKMVYIEDVPNGLACNCRCPQCHEALIARNGGEIREDTRGCQGTGISTLPYP